MPGVYQKPDKTAVKTVRILGCAFIGRKRVIPDLQRLPAIASGPSADQYIAKFQYTVKPEGGNVNHRQAGTEQGQDNGKLKGQGFLKMKGHCIEDAGQSQFTVIKASVHMELGCHGVSRDHGTYCGQKTNRRFGRQPGDSCHRFPKRFQMAHQPHLHEQLHPEKANKHDRPHSKHQVRRKHH